MKNTRGQAAYLEGLQYNVIDLQKVQAEVEMVRNKELLAKHPYVITKRKDGKYYTYLPDEVYGRVQRKRNYIGGAL